MIKFNPENKDTLTYGEALGPAMDVQTEEEAKQYFQDYVAYQKEQIRRDPKASGGRSAEEVCKINIGYWTGYVSFKTALRVMQLFETAHPIFGKINPTAEEALKAGKELANE